MRKKIIIGVSIVLLIAVLFGVYIKFLSPTKIALVNFPNFQTAAIAKSTDNFFIKVKEVPIDELNKIKNYDAILIFGMGINIDASQREFIKKVAQKGTPVFTIAATNPENNICNIDSINANKLSDYLGNGSKRNYQNMLYFIRQQLDKKTAFTPATEPPKELEPDVFYHIGDENYFTSFDEYEKYYRQKQFYKGDKAPRLAIVGGMTVPFGGNSAHSDSIINAFENAGYNVYPISTIFKRFEFLRQINPDAVLYMPHGRLMMGGGDRAAEWLKERNIPLFCPLTILRPETEWLEDKMGMLGGFLSQSIAMPELDGGIVPYSLIAQYVDKDGYYIFKAIPDRLKNFVDIVNNYISLKHKPNAEKKIVIYYFKGVGQNAMSAAGLETIPSLYNFLKRLKTEGYKVNLPATEKEFQNLIMKQGVVLGSYAEGAFDNYLQEGNPELIEKSIYESWVKQNLPSQKYKEVTNQYGEAPGNYMALEKEDKQYLAVARINLGNVVLLPQPLPAIGENTFQIIHGTKSAPPHTYIASYLWAQYGFKADALIHFGTHGSLEFTPEKQIALSSMDWPDRLVGTLPHFYLYTISNVGEGVIAKRRSYAGLISYLTAPFMESNTRSQYKDLQGNINIYRSKNSEQNALSVKKSAIALGLHRDLQLDSNLNKAYSEEEIERIENFAEEIATERMQGTPYILGIPYQDAQIISSVYAMSTDPIAYNLAALDRLHGRITQKQLNNKVFFSQRYLTQSKQLVGEILSGKIQINDNLLAKLSHIPSNEIAEAREIFQKPKQNRMPMGMGSRNTGSNSSMKESGQKPKHPEGISMEMGGKHPHSNTSKEGMIEMKKNSLKPENKNSIDSKNKKELYRALFELEHTLENVQNYRAFLQQSPEVELRSLLNALNGGYISPSPGGDPISNPNTLPTGRNLFAINVEATPSETAWTKGVQLAKETIEQYKKKNGDYPKKVSYTLWSSEFIETEGATIAQILYMLGTEPVRDAYGRVSDLQLISSSTLGRPRIDVLIQVSGQLRDIAASRLFLINRAVEMAAAARKEEFSNFVAQGAVDAEHSLVEKGVSPKDARELSTARIFGGINGGYGTGITAMVESGGRWEKEEEIANTYLNNMGAMYGNEKAWGKHARDVFEAAVKNTDAVVQPRQSNTWGALSLDHVYEFMGGLNLTVRYVTGKDPETYFSDYRNRNNVRIQSLKEAVGIEARTTIFNPNYIKEQMKGSASAANNIAEVIRNTYGWNVMKPKLIDKEMWDNVYDIYVKDAYNLNIQSFFKKENPAALQEITAVMLETARKGYWQASETQLKDIADLHGELIEEFKPGCSGFVCDNAKLRDFIANKLESSKAQEYTKQIKNIREISASSDKGVVMKKEELSKKVHSEKKQYVNGIILVVSVVIVFILGIIYVKRKRKNNNQ